MSALFDILFPTLCLGCGRMGNTFCPSCRKTIHPLTTLKCPVCNHPAIDGVTHIRCRTRFEPDGLISFFPYTKLVRKAVKEIKYQRYYRVASDLIDLIPDEKFEDMRKIIGQKNPLILVPIPLHWRRWWTRGFNQSDIIAKEFSQQMSIPMRNDILKRIVSTIPQVEERDREHRLKNMKGVFAVSMIPDKNSTVILVDDVATTGATLREASHELKKSGVKNVWGMTLAQ